MSDNVFGVTPEAGADQGESPSPVPVSQTSDGDLEHDEATADGPDPAAPEPERTEPAKPEASGEEDEDAEDLSADPNDGFRIGDKVYRDVESADRAFKRQRGRAQSESRRRQETEERLARAEALLEKALSTHQQPQTQEQGTQAEPPPEPPKQKRLTDLVSAEQFNELVVEHGPAAAFAKIAELTEQRLAEALEESNREVRPLVRERQVNDRTAQTFDAAAAATGEDGKPLFPEIANPDTDEAKAVFNIWKRNFADPQLAPLAFTQHGIRVAVLEHRAANGQPASRGIRTAAGKAVTARRAADAGLQTMGTGSTRASVRPAAPGPVGNDEERIQAAQRARQHPIFGVAVSPRA